MSTSAFNLRNPAGVVGAAVGLAMAAVTLVGAGAVQLRNPLPPEGAFALLALGGVPAIFSMLVALWRGVRARRKLAASATGPIDSPGIRLAVTGLGLTALGAAFVTNDWWRRAQEQEGWVSEAQLAVESLLRHGERIPVELREELGDFRALTGEGFGGKFWNSQDFHYLIADRDAHFANGTIPLRIVVTGTTRAHTADHGITVHKVRLNTSNLYLQDTPLPKNPLTGLEIWVLHPELRRR